MYHNLSQILPKQHISNYSSNQSLGAQKFCTKKASPSLQEGDKDPTNRLFSRGTRQAPTLVAPLRAPMSECDYKIHNIYLTLIYMYISKYTQECTQLNYFFSKFSEEHTLESSSNEIEQCCIRTVRTTPQAGWITISPII